MLRYIFLLHQTTTLAAAGLNPNLLRYIFLLHQTTTITCTIQDSPMLRYIFLLHQTTTVTTSVACVLGCVISFFYIKPQPYNESFGDLQVALYLSSTSNHNVLTQQKKRK